ncbi:MAG: quinol:cytochrome C oxidoreductase [Flavobacteriales bacterium]
MANDKLQFEIPAKTKQWSMILMGIGLVSLIAGWFLDKTHHQYWWANLLISGFFFFALSLGAMFFYALQYAAEVAWSSQLKRIFEAMFSYVPYGLAAVGLVLLAGQLHWHHLYHWMDSEVVNPENKEKYDVIIAGKMPFLSSWFFWLRFILYSVVFIVFARFFRQWSVLEDTNPSVDLHLKQYRRGALFLVFFAVFSSTLAWDWLMSIDTHWFSTMYGWYIFSGMWVTTMIFTTLFVLWLKGKGYLPKVNDSHIHDLGKWVFAISMLWSYLWFCQYMLIWYSDIPEEITYFKERYDHYMYGMWAIFFCNFAIPFYVLIARDAKRNPKFLWIVGSIIFVTHFLDLYMAVVPGTTHGHIMWGGGEHGSHVTFVGWFEFGTFLGFLGLFLFVVTNTLTKAKMIPVNHPYLNESENHHI